MPQINESADYVKDDHFSVDDFKAIATMTSQDFWKFIKDVVPPNQPLATRDKGATPDWTVKLVDGDQQHLLCFQLKSGNDEYSFEQILDELAKCSQMEIANEAYGYSEIVYREAEKHGVKLTFVFGSISHTKVEAQLCLKDYHRLAPSNSFALRITHESWKKVPEHVEIIILRESGMKSTLGLENYEFIANTVLENEVDYSMSDDDQKHLSTEDVKKLIERYASKFSDFNVDVKVTRKVSTSPAHVIVASFPVPQ